MYTISESTQNSIETNDDTLSQVVSYNIPEDCCMVIDGMAIAVDALTGDVASFSCRKTIRKSGEELVFISPSSGADSYTATDASLSGCAFQIQLGDLENPTVSGYVAGMAGKTIGWNVQLQLRYLTLS